MIIHVNRHHIAMNAKDGGNRPVYTIKDGRKTRYAREVRIDGPCRLVYDGRKLKCGTRAWTAGREIKAESADQQREQVTCEP